MTEAHVGRRVTQWRGGQHSEVADVGGVGKGRGSGPAHRGRRPRPAPAPAHEDAQSPTPEPERLSDGKPAAFTEEQRTRLYFIRPFSFPEKTDQWADDDSCFDLRVSRPGSEPPLS